MDFPGQVPILPVISCWSNYAIGPSAKGATVTNLTPVGAAGTTWPSADRALYIPFVLPGNFLVRALWWANGNAVAGNVDCGIYSESGALLTNTGSTAQAGVTAIQSVTLGTPLLLTAGRYNMALVLSSASGRIYRNNVTGVTTLAGVTQMASAMPLPATFVPATAAAAFIPVFGIASRTLI